VSASAVTADPGIATEAEALAERLVVLSEQMLVVVARGDTDLLAALLAEHEGVRDRLALEIAAVRGTYDRFGGVGNPAAEAAGAALSRLQAQLQRAYEANRMLEDRAAAVCAGLESQLAMHKKRSGAVLAYGADNEVSGSAFTRVG
jgi:hypothetical protein